MLASGWADAGYMFVLGCSRFRLHSVVTVAMSWGYAAAITAVTLTVGLTVLRATALWAAFQLVKGGVLLAASLRAEGVAFPRLKLLRECVVFGLGAWIGTLSTAINQRLDQVLVAVIASEAVLGIYATAVNSFEILLYLAGAASTAILPLGSRASAGARTADILRAYRAVTILTAAGAVLAAILGAQLIPLVFGSAFEASNVPFLLLLPGALGFVALSIFSSALVAAFAPRRSSAGPVVSLALGLVLDILLIPTHGATGAAIATTTALLTGGATSLVLYATCDRFPLRELVTPRRSDLALLGALARPFARSGTPRGYRRAGLARTQDPVAIGDCDRLGLTVDIELPEDVLHMGRHRLGADVQAPGDVVGPQPVAQEVEHFVLSLRQPPATRGDS
jgi:O-antigen/teichoic acid export membrane protein